jgi:pimeloyl-ACP methyl ester carboxylesterase
LTIEHCALSVSHHSASFGEISLHWVEQGEGSPVVLLHGFPEFWYSWRHQLPALAAAGFRALAPDLRGYNQSDKPAGVGNYALPLVAGDVIRFIEELAQPVALVGHDWGGIIAWRVARQRPDLLHRLVILNAPYPRAIIRAMRSPQQLWRFWYQLALQPPFLPELVLNARRHAFLRTIMLRAARRRGALTADDLAMYQEAWSQSGALTAMANYYRALYRRRSGRAARNPTHAPIPPSMMIWGMEDAVFLPPTAAASNEYVRDLHIQWVDGAGHFVQWDAPERVNELLLDFLR